MGTAAQVAVPPSRPVANPPQLSLPGPRIKFATPTYDFVKAKVGDVVKHSFIFTNTGETMLEITDVRPGCGCTAAGAWDKHVEPGKTGSIPIQLSTAGFGGMISKNVTVMCNDPTQPTTILYLKGNVWKPVDVNPTFVIFNLVSEVPTNEVKVARIVSNLDEPLTLSEPECTNKTFKTELKVIRPGKEFEVQISVVPPFAPGSLQTPVVVKTSHPEVPSIMVNVFAMIQPSVMILPAQIILPPGPLTSPVRSSVTVRNNGSTNIAVSEPAINLPGLDVQVQTAQAGRYFNLVVNFPAGFQLQPGQRAELTAKTDHPSYPIVKVPVYQQTRPQPPPSVPLHPAPPPPRPVASPVVPIGPPAPQARPLPSVVPFGPPLPPMRSVTNVNPARISG